MGFGKAFGFSLLAYVGLNFLFVIITNTITGELNALFSSIAADPLTLFVYLLYPVVVTPTSVFNLVLVDIFFGVLDAGAIVLYIGYIVTPIIASIIAGKVGDNKGASFGGWFLTTIVMSLVIIILILTGSLTGMSEIEVLIFGIINGIAYGVFAVLFTSTEYY